MPWMLPPKVEDTVSKYLETVRPLLDDEKFDEITQQAEEFKKTVASGIQRKLWMKWLISRNYVCLIGDQKNAWFRSRIGGKKLFT